MIDDPALDGDGYQLVVGEVEAWKALSVHGPKGAPRLFSPVGVRGPLSLVWPTSAYFYARCRRCKEIPGKGCGCGVYALKEWEEVIDQGYASFRGVIAKIALAGKIVPGDKGYRAARARVAHLYVPHVMWRTGELLGAAYGVEVTLANVMKPVEEVASGH